MRYRKIVCGAVLPFKLTSSFIRDSIEDDQRRESQAEIYLDWKNQDASDQQDANDHEAQ